MSKKSFTLIELLVVIAIIGILSGFVYIQTDNAINSGKDAKRKSDIALLSTAVVSYSSEHYSLTPVTDANGCTIGGGSDPCSTDIEDTIQSYLGLLPEDPNVDGYYTYQSDGNDCTISATLSTGGTYQYLCSTNESTVGTPASGSCGTKANTLSTGYAASQTDWTTNTTYCSSTSPTTTPAFPTTPGSSVSWVCLGTYLGMSVSCTAYHAADGSCGSGTANTYTIPTSGFCSSGSTSSISGSGPWSWNCSGTYGGSTASCTANKSVDGVCGSSNSANLYTIPSSNLCSAGTATSPSGSGPWSWSCTGLYGGTTATCSANKKIDGVCGSSNASYLYSAPTNNLCSTGTASASGAWSWTCSGQNTGATVSCSAIQKIDGVCGSSNASYLYSAPTSGLCTTGTASASGAWSWTCSGQNTGATVSCSAIQKIDGACGSSNGANFYSAPTSGLCTTGTASASGAWSWNCVGQNTGATVSCSANQSVNGACGTANGQLYGSTPTSGLCSIGTASSVTGTFSWTCAGSSGGSTASCSATYGVSPSCGGSGPFSSSSSCGCSSGSMSGLTGSGGWSWTCNGLGIYSGSSVGCSASYRAPCSACAACYDGLCVTCVHDGCPSGWTPDAGSWGWFGGYTLCPYDGSAGYCK